MPRWTFAGWQLVATWCFCWNVHSVWPCPSVNRIVKADSCVTSSCKQPSPFPFLNCSVQQSWEVLLPRQSAVRVADKSNWKNHWGGEKKAVWGHLSLNVPDCENSGHLFASSEGAGLKCLIARQDWKLAFQGRPLLDGRQVSVFLHDVLGAALFPAEEEKEVAGVQLELTLV